MTRPSLDRAIGPVSATLLVIGSVIGSGIFLTTGAMAQIMPSASLILLAWAAGCLFALTGALTYAELGTMFPRSGGVYVFLGEAFGPLVGFLYGWASLLVVLSGGIAAVAIGFADSLSYFLPALSPARIVVVVPVAGGWTIAAHQLVAAGSILLLGAINYFGVRSGSGTNALLTVAKVTGLFLIVVFAVTSSRAAPAWTPIVPPQLASPLGAFGIAVIAVLWAAEGYYFLTYAAGEVRDPARTLPRALIVGLSAIAVIYLAANLAYLYALPMDQLRGATRVAERAATALVGAIGATIVTVTVLVSTLGANAAVILAGSRLLFAMAEGGLFFARAAAVHPRFRTPHVAVMSLTGWSSLLALTGTYEQLFTYVVFTSVIFSLLGGLALFQLRRTRPAADRPYRVWGYPAVPAAFVLSALILAMNTLRQRPRESLAGLFLLEADPPRPDAVSPQPPAITSSGFPNARSNRGATVRGRQDERVGTRTTTERSTVKDRRIGRPRGQRSSMSSATARSTAARSTLLPSATTRSGRRTFRSARGCPARRSTAASSAISGCVNPLSSVASTISATCSWRLKKSMLRPMSSSSAARSAASATSRPARGSRRCMKVAMMARRRSAASARQPSNRAARDRREASLIAATAGSLVAFML
jgi:basic amino acid/polyamine antiporter, APA family